MGDFDRIIEQAKKMDELALQRNIENQRQIHEFWKMNAYTYGKSRFFQTKDELDELTGTMMKTFQSPEFAMFGSVKDANDEAELADDKDKLLFRLRAELENINSNNRRYTEIRSGFEEENLEKTISLEQQAFADTLSSIQAASDVLDQLMMYDISDSKEFDDLYVSFNNVRKRYSDVAEGSLNIIQDSYDRGQKVHKINGKNPKTDTAFAKQLAGEAIRRANNEPPREDLKAEWLPEPEPLFSHDPCPEDVMQGHVGDCYFVSALASIAAQNPDRIREMIKLREVETKDPADHTKTVKSTVAVVRLYSPKNEPVDVTVPYTSCYLTGKSEGKQFAEPMYASGAAWVKMIEKALVVSGLQSKHSGNFSKALSDSYHPDYDEISGGDSHEVMQTLLGPEMAQKFQGKADIRKYEIPLLSEQQYEKIEDNLADKQEKLIEFSKNELETANKGFGKVRSSCKSGIKKHFQWKEDVKPEDYDKLIEEMLAKPESATQYLSQKPKDDLDPKDFFERAGKKDAELRGKAAEAQKTLDKYDPAKNQRPKFFPTEYADEELNMFARLQGIHNSGQPLTAGTQLIENDDRQYKGAAAGLPFGHAYSITNFYEEPNGIKYVEVRNPHNIGTRQYDADGKPYFDPDTSKMGVSKVELRDFIKTFETVYFGQYEPQMTYEEKSERVKETMDLYGEALLSICNIIDRSDTYKKSPEYNALRADSKTLMAKLKDKDVNYTSLQESIDNFFDKAEKYKAHRDPETSARRFNKESAANRYIASEAALKIRDAMRANQLPGAVKQRVDLRDVLKECMTVKENDNISKKSSVEVLKGIETKAKIKQQKNLAKALELETKVSDTAEKQLEKAIREQNGPEIITAIATMVYLDDVNSKIGEISPEALTDKFSREGFKHGIDLYMNPVTEALTDQFKKKGPEKFFEDLASEENPVKMIKDTWKAQAKERHPEKEQEVKENQPPKITM